MITKSVATILTAGALVATGCGGDDGGNHAGVDGRTRLTVQLLPIWDVAPVYLVPDLDALIRPGFCEG